MNQPLTPGGFLWNMLDQGYANGQLSIEGFNNAVALGWHPPRPNKTLSRGQRMKPKKVEPKGDGLETTTTSDLDKIADKLELKNFKVYSKLDLPKKLKVGNYIINIDNGQAGSHWVALHSSTKQGTVYFDSFGMPPDPAILKLIKSIKRKARAIELDAQDIKSSSCGYWALFFLFQMQNGTSIGEFMGMISDDQDENEEMLEDWFEMRGKGLFDWVKKGFSSIVSPVVEKIHKYNATPQTVRFTDENHVPGHNFSGQLGSSDGSKAIASH